MAKYGLGTPTAAAAPGTASATIAAGAVGTYTFSEAQRKVLIVNHPDTGKLLYIRWNGTASATALNAIAQAGDTVPSPDGIVVTTISIYNADATDTATYQTDFYVEGWT